MFETIIAVLTDFLSFFNYKTKAGRIKLIALIILLTIIVIVIKQNGNDEPTSQDELLPQVFVSTASNFGKQNTFTTIGNIEAKDQAIIQAEASGQVVRVNKELGQIIQAGEVIAQLENSSAYASLLQAEGAYEAAVANAGQSAISVESAENNLDSVNDAALATLKSGFSTINSLILSDIDVFYSDLNSPIVGVRIDVQNESALLINERNILQTDLNNWQAYGFNTESLASELIAVQNTLEKTINLIDKFVYYTNIADESDSLNGQSVDSYTNTLNSARSTAVSVLSGINQSLTNINAAEDAVNQAKLAGASNTSSTADAQVKQALGSLRAAQANYNKTLITSPISGTINELRLKTGDYINSGSQVALVANNDAIEITTFVNENDSNKISIGDSVQLKNDLTGIVSAVSPSVDSLTKKIEVKIAAETDKLKTGDTISVSFTVTEDSDLAVIAVPLTAVKFTATSGSIFTVEDGKLKSHSVEIGSVTGSNVIVSSGLDDQTEFVVDARGLSEGEEVEVIK